MCTFQPGLKPGPHTGWDLGLNCGVSQELHFSAPPGHSKFYKEYTMLIR